MLKNSKKKNGGYFLDKILVFNNWDFCSGQISLLVLGTTPAPGRFAVSHRILIFKICNLFTNLYHCSLMKNISYLSVNKEKSEAFIKTTQTELAEDKSQIFLTSLTQDHFANLIKYV